MTIKNNQTEDAPKVLTEGAGPTTGTNKGSFFPKDVAGITEGFFKDDQGRDIQLTDDGSPAGGGGAGEANDGSNVGSGAGNVYKDKDGVTLRFRKIKAGTNVTVTEVGDDITIDAAGGAGEANDGANVGTGAGVYKDKDGVNIRLKSIKAGTNVTIDEAADDLTINASGGGGSSDEYFFTLPAGATIAARVAASSDIPAGWTVEDASTAGEANFGSSANTLVMEHNETKYAQEISVLEITNSGPASVQKVVKIDLSNPGDQRSNVALSSCAVMDLISKIDAGRDVKVFVKLVG
jgi:hypothetical protein